MYTDQLTTATEPSSRTLRMNLRRSAGVSLSIPIGETSPLSKSYACWRAACPPRAVPAVAVFSIDASKLGLTPKLPMADAGDPQFLYIFALPFVNRLGRDIPVDELDIWTELERLHTAIGRKDLNVIVKPGMRETMVNWHDPSVRILHYSGHGEKDGLAFEKDNGTMDFVGIEDLGGSPATEHIKLAVVSACHSENVAKEVFVRGAFCMARLPFRGRDCAHTSFRMIAFGCSQVFASNMSSQWIITKN